MGIFIDLTGRKVKLPLRFVEEPRAVPRHVVFQLDLASLGKTGGVALQNQLTNGLFRGQLTAFQLFALGIQQKLHIIPVRSVLPGHIDHQVGIAAAVVKYIIVFPQGHGVYGLLAAIYPALCRVEGHDIKQAFLCHALRHGQISFLFCIPIPGFEQRFMLYAFDAKLGFHDHLHQVGGYGAVLGQAVPVDIPGQHEEIL